MKQVTWFEVKIDKNIPFPVPPDRPEGGWKVVIVKMQIGDSFECAYTSYPAIHCAAKKLNMKMTVRKLPQGRIRIWRVK